MDEAQEVGIEAVVLPTGQVIERSVMLSFRYNPGVGALRFSFVAPSYRPLGYDKLTDRITAINEGEARVTVVGYRHFRFQNRLYIQDADVRQPRHFK